LGVVSCRDRVPCLIPSSGCVIRSFGPQLRPARLRRSIASPCQDREQVRRAISSRVNHQCNSFGSAPSRGGHLDGWFHNAPDGSHNGLLLERSGTERCSLSVANDNRTSLDCHCIIRFSRIMAAWEELFVFACQNASASMHRHRCRPGNPHPL
jgi:hypothetical protein